MKLRQKLAMVLAAAMVVTAVPVATFAASSNAIVNKQVGKKDRIYTNDATGPILRIKLDDSVDTTERGGLFYLEVEGFEFEASEYRRDNEIFTNVRDAQGDVIGKYSFGDLTVESNKKVLRVNLTGYADPDDGLNIAGIIPEDTILYIPLFGKVTSDKATVTIDNNGFEITESTLTFAESKDQKCIVTAEDTTNIYDEGVIGDIVFSEPYENVVKSKLNKVVDSNGNEVTTLDGNDEYFKVEITTDNQDFEFYKSARTLTVEFGKGFNGSTSTVSNGVVVTSKYGDEIELYIPVRDFANWNSSTNQYDFSNSKGTFRIKGIEVRANTKTPTAGELKVNVKGELGEATGLKVADIVLTDTKVYMEDEKTLDIVAGQSKDDAVFFLEENIKDGILPNHTVDFELSKGYFGVYDGAKDIKKATRTDKVQSAQKIIKAKNDSKNIPLEIVDVKMDGDKFIGFTVKFVGPNGQDAANLADKDKYKFEAPICVDLDTEDGTEIKLTASAERSIDEEVSCVAAKVKAPIKITADAMPVKVGLQDQKYNGKIVITETDKGMIKRGELVISTPAEGYKFTGKGEVKVTSGDLVIKDWDIKTIDNDKKDDSIVIEVKNVSKTASTIEITGFDVELDRTVPEGAYKLEFAGNSLASEHAKAGQHAHGSIKVEKFFKVNTPNTEDIKNGALKAVIAKFTADSKEYSVDGEVKTMDAAAYIQNDRIMVPARYVAEAFGISEQNVLFSNGVATIIAGEKIVQIKVGSDVITVNGMAIKMDTKAVVKEGRTYLPLKFIAVALGVESSYDSATKTATFSNRDAK